MNSPITWTDVSALEPALAAVTTAATQDIIIAEAYAFCDAKRFGAKRDRGALYLAAHIGIMAMRGGVAGPVTSQGLGDASESYAVMPASTAMMNGAATSWGAMFLALVRGLGPLAVTV